MADETEKILNIRVNYSEAVKGIEEYKKKIEQAKEAMDGFDEMLAEGKISQKEYNEGMATASNVIKVYQGNIRTLNKEIQNNIKEQQTQDGSLTQLRARLSNLTKEYDNLSASERESGKRGEELRKAINDTTTQIKGAEEATQRYYRNVGNYENAIKNTLGVQGQWFTKLQDLSTLMQGGMDNALKSVGTAIANVGKQMLALLMNPIVAAITAIAAAFMVLHNALKSNEEGNRALQRVMAPFEGLLNVIIDKVQKFAQVIITAVEGLENMAMGLSRLAEKLPVVGKYFAEVNDKIDDNIELTRAQQELEDEQRRALVQTAKDENKIAELRKKAAAESDPMKRAEKLKEALRIEEEVMKRNLVLAEKEYNNAKKAAEQKGNTAEENKELAQLEANLYRVRAAYNQGTMRITSQLRSANEQAAREYTAQQKAMGEAAKKRATEAAAAAKAEQDAVRQAEDALIAIIKDNYEKQRAQTEAQYDRQIADLKKRLETEKNLTEVTIANINTTIAALYQQRADAIKAIDEQASAERLNKAIANEQERLRLVIETTRKGSEEQYNARMALLQQEQDAATAAIEQSELTETEKQERLLLINQSYDQKRTELRVAQNQSEMDAAQQAFEEKLQQNLDNSVAQAEIEMEQKKAALDALHQMEGESDDEFKARRLKAEDDFLKSKKKYDQMQIQSAQAKMKVMSAIAGGLSNILDAFGEENKAAAIASKMLAIGQIAVSTGVAIAQGVQQAQSVPFPANLAAIATTIGTILANVATAVSTVKSAKFAEGGYVSGEGTSTSDSISAQLSNGESVNTAKTTALFAPLLSTLNQIGGGVPIVTPTPQYTSQSASGENEGMAMIKEAMSEAIAEMPTPVVSVEEINDKQHRVEVIETLAKNG